MPQFLCSQSRDTQEPPNGSEALDPGAGKEPRVRQEGGNQVVKGKALLLLPFEY